MSALLPDPEERRVLVAWDGSPDSAGALRLARRLRERDGCEVDVLAVLEPLPVFDTGFMVALPESELYTSRAEAVRTELEETLEEVGGDAPDWPLHLETGLAAVTIAERVAGLGAHLVLTGLGRHRAVDRIFGTETVLQLLHLVHVPVLATPEDVGEVPEIAVLAMDFSSFGYRAARAAVHLLGPDTTLHLVHVLAGSKHLPAHDDWRGPYEEEIRERLAGVARQLKGGKEQVGIHLLEGDPAEEILAVSAEVGAELVAAGSHGHSFLGRLVMGSVSARLVRRARVPLLVVPPSAAMPVQERREGEEERPESQPGRPHRWVEMLQDFTLQHAGRRTSLDVEAPAWGARHSGANFPLRGVDYDPRTDRIEIMLGEAGAGAPHFTHSIPEPDRVEIVRDGKGREVSLQVEAVGQRVTLTLHRPPVSGTELGSGSSTPEPGS